MAHRGEAQASERRRIRRYKGRVIGYGALQELGIIDDGAMVLRVSEETRRIDPDIAEFFDDVDRFRIADRTSITPDG